ncbi:MAG: DUF2239 family protein [Bryobacterales bacterium]|nr:DUF2239 family protein [Bryobacterales bacterium]
MAKQTAVTAFEGSRLIASGDLATVAAAAKKVLDRGERGPVLLFDNRTSKQIEVDFRGDDAAVQARLTAEPNAEPQQEEKPRRPGRPKLGVVGKEVTLLPRHWEWLNAQPGGASVALRKLVDQARRSNETRDKVRAAQESAYRFISAMAGDEPNFEEACRALFAGDGSQFHTMSDLWPIDVRDHARDLAQPAFVTAV